MAGFDKPCLTVALAVEELGSPFSGAVDVAGLPANETRGQFALSNGGHLIFSHAFLEAPKEIGQIQKDAHVTLVVVSRVDPAAMRKGERSAIWIGSVVDRPFGAVDNEEDRVTR